MKNYAIIRIKGKQYKVTEGDEIDVDYLGMERPDAEVLLVVNNDKVKVGKPKVRNSKVTYKVLNENLKGKKISVLTYKAKSRYRRKKGFRPQLTRIKIGKIS